MLVFTGADRDDDSLATPSTASAAAAAAAANRSRFIIFTSAMDGDGEDDILCRAEAGKVRFRELDSRIAGTLVEGSREKTTESPAAVTLCSK